MLEIKNIYCDFDGTITCKDVVNTFYEQYAKPEWKDSEKLWEEGKITSRENTSLQVKLINKVAPLELEKFLRSIELTPLFIEFVEYLKENHIKLTILSDGFDYFIKKILEYNNIEGIEIYSNHLIYQNGKFDINFPNYNKKCDIGSGMCKCAKIKPEDLNNFCYIGDGTSDLCIAKKAKYLFAAKSLYKYCVNNNIKNIYFENFGDIIKTLKEINGV